LALRSQTAAAAASQHRRQPLQPQVLPTEMEIKTPEIRIFRKVMETRKIIKDKATLTMAVTMAATEITMLITESHLNAK
jgi:hypothetical protein